MQRYGTDRGAIHAGMVTMSVVPAMIVCGIFQRQFITGTTAGAVKA
ncbi:hypothetical protein [Limnochorda pilosa]|uniref:Uncharacterized protein n=1 Tax=Limnochorda pilosa TaxID=1555112 RepID=A0A0K2SMF8_LIMPI|nr:hypothetical protein [Limnochorda pilosa]BAS28290.1 hypothetical protein LIP_2449 [Limnochorda pilosa]